MNSSDFLLALCLWREARGQSSAARAGIAAVILNRAMDAKGRWPKSIWEVILQPRQFSSFNAGDPNATLWPHASNGGDWKAWQDILSEVFTPIGGDSTNGANHYESEPEDARPAWADSTKLTTTIGPFRFYRL